MWDYARSEDEVAVDFSDGMFGELRQAVDEAGVGIASPSSVMHGRRVGTAS